MDDKKFAWHWLARRCNIVPSSLLWNVNLRVTFTFSQTSCLDVARFCKNFANFRVVEKKTNTHNARMTNFDSSGETFRWINGEREKNKSADKRIRVEKRVQSEKSKKKKSGRERERRRGVWTYRRICIRGRGEERLGAHRKSSRPGAARARDRVNKRWKFIKTQAQSSWVHRSRERPVNRFAAVPDGDNSITALQRNPPCERCKNNYPGLSLSLEKNRFFFG